MSVCFHLVFISDFNSREFVRVSALHFGTILVLPAPVSEKHVKRHISIEMCSFMCYYDSSIIFKSPEHLYQYSNEPNNSSQEDRSHMLQH